MGKPQLVAASGSVLTSPNSTEFAYSSIDEAFPKVAPGMRPCGFVALFQIRIAKGRTKGGIILVDESRSTEYYNTQVAKVVALGPLCFKTAKEVPSRNGGPAQDVLVDWCEGPWFNVGDFVRLPKYGGDRFAVPYEHVEMVRDPETGQMEKQTIKEDVIFALFKAKDVIGVLTGDPLRVKAFLD